MRERQNAQGSGCCFARFVVVEMGDEIPACAGKTRLYRVVRFLET